MKITRIEFLAQVKRIDAILTLIENVGVQGDYDRDQLEYINDLSSKMNVLTDWTMDKVKILEDATQKILESVTK